MRPDAMNDADINLACDEDRYRILSVTCLDAEVRRRPL